MLLIRNEDYDTIAIKPLLPIPDVKNKVLAVKKRKVIDLEELFESTFCDCIMEAVLKKEG